VSIEAVQRKHEEQLMRLPNVVGVGIGQKEGKEVLKVFVTRKVPEASLRAEEIVPKTLEGIATDVDEIGTITAQSPQP
jgi:hypothetical protein